MQRRTTAQSGWVRFPVDDPRYRNSGEGGMLVKLVAVEPPDLPEARAFGVCCGAQVWDLLTEVLIGDDQCPPPAAPVDYADPEAVRTEQAAHLDWVRRHYPYYGDLSVSPREQECAGPALAVLVLGTTGWSGWDEAAGRYWQCAFDDLSPEGQALYRQLQALYPQARLHLLTFLDT